MGRKMLRIMAFLLIVILGISFIRIGLYLEKISSPKNIYKSGIDIITTKIQDVVSVDKKYYLGDNYSVNGKMSVNVTSEEYQKKALTNLNYQTKNNYINNLNKMTIDYDFIQNKNNKNLYLSVNAKNPKKSIINSKLLVEKSTQYFFVEEIINNYINEGSNNYFEMFTEEKTTLDNLNYMYDFITASLAKQLGEESEKYKKTTTINNTSQELNQISVRLDNKTVNNIISGIITDIKEDKQANKIMTSIDSGFSKRKIKEKTYLEKKESYTLNVYCSKYLNTPLKYEIIYLNQNDKKIYSYEGNENKGLFYYSENDNLKYSADYSSTTKTIDIKVHDKYQKDVGDIKLNKDTNNTLINISLDLDKDNYDIVYSKKYKNYSKNKSYEIENIITFKIIGQKDIKLAGDITMNTTVSKEAKIDENIDNPVFKSKLTEEQKNKYDNLYNNIKGRLENE